MCSCAPDWLTQSGPAPQRFLCVFNGKLYFSAYDRYKGRELWSYDDTNAPSRERDIPSPSSGSRPVMRPPHAQSRLQSPVQAAHPRVHTPTQRASSFTHARNRCLEQEGLTVFNGKLYFQADDSSDGKELFEYDGHQLADELGPAIRWE